MSQSEAERVEMTGWKVKGRKEKAVRSVEY